METYITRARIKEIRSAAERAPESRTERKVLDIELLSFLRILDLLISEKENISEAIKKEFSSTSQIITTIPSIGPVTGYIIVAKIGKIERFDDAGKLVAFAVIDTVDTDVLPLLSLVKYICQAQKTDLLFLRDIIINSILIMTKERKENEKRGISKKRVSRTQKILRRDRDLQQDT